MFVELIELLRCPNEHAEAQLVAATTLVEARHIVTGVLGCPVCGAEFPVSDGVARFGDPGVLGPLEPPSAEVGMRLAAFLELTDARGFALLCGRWGAHADQIRRVSETPLLLVNPPDGVIAEVAGVVSTARRLPLAPETARAAAIDESASPELAQSIVDAVRTGGRVVGSTQQPPPPGLTELTRDATMWVGEKTARRDPTPRLVPLRKAPR